MMDYAKNVFCAMCLAVALIVSLFWFDAYLRNKSLTRQVTFYENQIDELHRKADEQAERYENAQKQADQQMRRIQDEGKLILAAKVPKDCNDAMKWALNEAHNFS